MADGRVLERVDNIVVRLYINDNLEEQHKFLHIARILTDSDGTKKWGCLFGDCRDPAICGYPPCLQDGIEPVGGADLADLPPIENGFPTACPDCLAAHPECVGIHDLTGWSPDKPSCSCLRCDEDMKDRVALELTLSLEDSREIQAANTPEELGEVFARRGCDNFRTLMCERSPGLAVFALEKALLAVDDAGEHKFLKDSFTRDRPRKPKGKILVAGFGKKLQKLSAVEFGEEGGCTRGTCCGPRGFGVWVALNQSTWKDIGVPWCTDCIDRGIAGSCVLSTPTADDPRHLCPYHLQLEKANAAPAGDLSAWSLETYAFYLTLNGTAEHLEEPLVQHDHPEMVSRNEQTFAFGGRARGDIVIGTGLIGAVDEINGRFHRTGYDPSRESTGLIFRGLELVWWGALRVSVSMVGTPDVVAANLDPMAIDAATEIKAEMLRRGQPAATDDIELGIYVIGYPADHKIIPFLVEVVRCINSGVDPREGSWMWPAVRRWQEATNGRNGAITLMGVGLRGRKGNGTIRGALTDADYTQKVNLLGG